ncbi:unnamed protein product, partial [marine sediment metagenome]
HRSENSKELFSRANKIVNNSDRINCLHLFSVILEERGDSIYTLFQEFGINHEELRNKALFYANLLHKLNSDEDSLYI